MKIAISIDSNTLSGIISSSFSRAPYFMIHDTKTKETSFIENTQNVIQKGAGPRVVEMLKAEKIDTAIAESCGENVAGALNENGVVFYYAKNISAATALGKILNHQLDLLSDIHKSQQN